MSFSPAGSLERQACLPRLCLLFISFHSCSRRFIQGFPITVAIFGMGIAHTGGERTLTQWVHCEFVVRFEAIRPVVTQQVSGEFF